MDGVRPIFGSLRGLVQRCAGPFLRSQKVQPFKSNIQSTWPSSQKQQEQEQPRDSTGRFIPKVEEDLMEVYLRRRTLIDKLPLTCTPQFVQNEPVEDLLGTHLSRCQNHVEKIRSQPKGKPAHLQYYLWY